MTSNHYDNVALSISTDDIVKSTSLIPKDDLISENGAATDINGHISPNAQYNFENSSDIIIGPVTQLIGPVTIYHQHVNGSQIQLTGDSVDEINKEAKVVEKPPLAESPKPPLGKKRITSKTLVIVFTAIFLGCIFLALIFAMLLIPKNDRYITDAPIIPTLFSTEAPAEALGHHLLLYRSQWGGRLPKYIRPLVHPTKLVIISHTATEFCGVKAACSDKVQSFQSYHVSKNSPDIGYNFLIGGDSNIYVGRGWDAQNFHQNNSIGISFIGNYLFDELSADMIEAARMLIERGVVLGKLDKDYELIAHNQTFATESPGANVYRIIKTWPHFDNKTHYP